MRKVMSEKDGSHGEFVFGDVDANRSGIESKGPERMSTFCSVRRGVFLELVKGFQALKFFFIYVVMKCFALFGFDLEQRTSGAGPSVTE
jgi:hypothetical protein